MRFIIDKDNSKRLLNRLFRGDTIEIASNIIDRMEDSFKYQELIYDNIVDCFNDEVIYTCDQWAIIHSYISPSEVGIVEASQIYNSFIDDIYECIVIR